MDMLRKSVWLVGALVVLSSTVTGQGPRRVALGDWPEMRGPNRDGVSRETGLPERWALNGENFLWRAPYGGRSAPIVMGNRIYVQNPAGRDADLQERVMCLDADTGKVIWEYKFSVFQSDVPPHRVGWASPAADPETGNIYILGAGAHVIALSRDGKKLWDRSLGEEFAAFTTHGGRTASPLVDGNLVIVSAALSNWGGMSNRAIRFVAFDKRTGEIVYVATPGGRPYDTAYSQPLITTINGMRLLIAGNGDGGIYAIKPQTGEKVWGYIAAKRAVNTAVVASGNSVIVSHGDENLDSSELGLIAAIDGTQTGDIKQTVWNVKGTQFNFSSPIIDGNRVYQVDTSAKLKAYDLAKGTALWTLDLGSTSQKAPAVFADGKIYVGTEGGKFVIVRPHADRGEILSSVALPISKNSVQQAEGTPEPILAGAAVSRGRVFFVSSDAVYAFGPKAAKTPAGFAADEPAVTGEGAPAFLQVSPTELVLRAGQTVKLRARSFDARGRFLREEKATWTLEGLSGTVTDGAFVAGSDSKDQAGFIRATSGTLKGEARARIARPLPLTEDFESLPEGSVPAGWVNATTGKFSVVTLDGRKVFQKAADETIFQRLRMFIGPVDWSDYTYEADVRVNTRRRQMGDMGITAQRYTLVLYGTAQLLKIEPWEPETKRTVSMPFKWDADAWYRLKLRVENLPNGAVRARGKAWPAAQPEPANWMLDKTDPFCNRQGAPGVFAAAQFGSYIDNIRITKNQ
jgi:outer membrane protein assembly factor BamB